MPAITLQASVGTVGGPEITSSSWTASAGDCVFVCWAMATGGTLPTVTLTTPGYTWNYIPPIQSTDTDIMMSGAYALNVPAGTTHFTTNGVGYDGITYFIFTISGGIVARDQLGTAYFPPADNTPPALITTAGPLVQSGEAAIAWWQCQFAPTTITAMPGWTSTPLQTNPSVGVINGLAVWNANAGTAGQKLTGGWSSIANAGGNGMTAQAIMATFSTIPPNLQPGFPRSSRIEEPSEGMQESNVTPPDMGVPN